MARCGHLDAEACQLGIERVAVIPLVAVELLGEVLDEASLQRVDDELRFMSRTRIRTAAVGGTPAPGGETPPRVTL